MRYRTVYLAALMTAVALVVLFAQCEVHALPPQAPPVRYSPAVSQAPPVRVEGVRDCGCGGDPFSGFCHCEKGKCDCSPITQGARWYRAGWRLDGNGQWYRWVSMGEEHRNGTSPGHHNGTVSISPSHYISAPAVMGEAHYPAPVLTGQGTGAVFPSPTYYASAPVSMSFPQRFNGGGFRSGGSC